MDVVLRTVLHHFTLETTTARASTSLIERRYIHGMAVGW